MNVFSKKLTLSSILFLLSCGYISNIYAADQFGNISNTEIKQKEDSVVTYCSTVMEELYLASNPDVAAKPSKFDSFKSAAKNLLGKKSSAPKITNDMYMSASNRYNAAITKYYDSRNNYQTTNIMKDSDLNTIKSQCQTAEKMLG
jgi:hypothetical protein